jgi:hypothetical protein
MSRPCICGKCIVGPYTLDQCRRCWLFNNVDDYRLLWGGIQPTTPERIKALQAEALKKNIKRGCAGCGKVRQSRLAEPPTTP